MRGTAVAGTVVAVMGLSLLPAVPAVAAPVSPFTLGGLIELGAWVADAEEWTTSPTVDGDLAEAVWTTGAVLTGFQVAASNATAAEPISYRVGWDDDALYLGGTFSEEEAATLAEIAVVLGDEDATSVHYVATVPVDPQRTIEADWNNPVVPPDGTDRIDVDADAEFGDGDPGEMVVEVEIPWGDLDVTTPTAGDSFSLNVVHVHNPGAAPMTSWVPIARTRYMDRDGGTVSYTTNLVDEGRWGVLTLSGPTGGDRWEPGDPELDFTGLTQKELTFDAPSPAPSGYELSWRSPDGEWAELASPAVSSSSGRVTLELQHPPVAVDGLHQLRVTANGSPDRVGVLAFDREALVQAGHAAQGFSASPPAPTVTVTPAAASPAVQDILDLIPDHNGFRFVGLPELPELSPEDQFTLAPDGQSMIATRTSTVYPNTTYAETQSITAYDKDGDPVEYPYYEDGEGNRFFLSAHLWYLQRQAALTQTAALAKTDPLGAARLLHRFAQTAQDYVPTTDQRGYNFPMDVGGGAPYNYWGGMWNSWVVNDLTSLGYLLDAYALVQQTDALAVLSTELGVDVEDLLVEQTLRPAFDYVLSYPNTYGNLTYPIWNALAKFSVLLGEPDHVHRAVEWIETFVESRFLTDGTFYEVTTSYHNQAYRGLVGALATLEGYTDPAGYVSPRSGTRFDDLDLVAQFPVLSPASQFVGRLVYPDGQTLPLQDTWAANRAATPDFGAGALLFPSAGLARTASGGGVDQSQVYLHYVPKYGHNHLDPLSLTFYDQRSELLPDLGYTHSKYYYFTTSTLGHNTVVVDADDMVIDSTSKHGGQIEQFVPDAGSISVMRAAQESAYPQTSEYSREPWFIEFPGSDDGYLLDVFRVEGGDRHEYTLNGYAADSRFITDLALDAYGDRLLPPGVVATEASDASERGSAEGHYPGYIYVTDVDEADISGADTYRVTVESTAPDGGEGASLEIFGLLEDGATELFLGRAPSIANTRDLGRDGDQIDILDDQTMPKLVLRREGNDLSSTFATVLEAHDGDVAGVVEGAERLELDSGPDHAVAVQVTYGDVTDIILSNSEAPGTAMTVGDVSMTGELGFIRIVDGDIVEMRLMNGTSLSKGGVGITGASPTEGDVVDTLRVAAGDAENAIITDVPVSSSAIGETVVVEHPDGTARGYRITDVTADGGGAALDLAAQDPGFTIDGTDSALDFYPMTSWVGDHTFGIPGRSALTGTPVADSPSTGTVTGTVVDGSSSPIVGATVSVSGLSSVTATTNGSGAFTLTGVPAGIRRVVVSVAGFETVVSDAVAVAASGSTVVDVEVAAELPPVLSGVPGAVAGGDDVAATSSKDANVYLVPIGTPKDVAAITAAAASGGDVVTGADANIAVQLSTTALDTGGYRVYAIDAQGGISLGATVHLLDPDPGDVDESDPTVTLSSGWQQFTNVSHFGGTSRRADTEGAWAELRFSGSAARIYAATTANGGYADVILDGVPIGTLDSYSTSTQYQQLVFDTGKLASGVHTLRLELTGTGRPASGGTFVSLDYISILQDAELPPVLSAVGSGPYVEGDSIPATADESGTLYVVPEATAANLTAVVAAAGSTGADAVAVAATATTIDTTGLATGRYVVYAADADDNLSAASSPIVVLEPVTGTLQESSALATYTGTWAAISGGSYSGGGIKRAQSTGASVEIPFYGSSVQVIGSKAPANGIADLYVDDVFVATVDTYAGSAAYQQVLHHVTGLTLGAHVLRLEATWTKNASATNYYVSLDALITAG